MEYRYFSCTYVVVCCVVSCIIRNICNGTFIVLLNLYLIFIWMNGYFACCFFNLCYLGIILYHMISKQLSVNVFFYFQLLITEKIYSKDEVARRSREQALCWYKEYLFGVLINLTIVQTLKVMVGAPRPHFFDTCSPKEALTCTGYVLCMTNVSSILKWT